MKKQSNRVIKKLSKRAALMMPNVHWDLSEEDPYCERFSSLMARTPILWYRCSYEYDEYESLCAWAVLKRLYIDERDTAALYKSEWRLPFYPTPKAVFDWARKNQKKLDGITEKRFGY